MKNAFCTLAVVLGVLVTPGPGFAELRPIVREMMENLGAVDQIGEGVALDDYEQVVQAAQDLKARAESLTKIDMASLRAKPSRDGQFKAYLRAQTEAAEAISQAAKREDGRAVMKGVGTLLSSACIACHMDFREGSNLLRSSTLFMTTFLQKWKEMNRGLAVNDFALIGRSAEALEATARVLFWDEVIEDTFDIEDPEERKEFRGILRKVASNASEVATAAKAEDKLRIVIATGEMWTGGCIACHERFRGID